MSIGEVKPDPNPLIDDGPELEDDEDRNADDDEDRNADDDDDDEEEDEDDEEELESDPSRIRNRMQDLVRRMQNDGGVSIRVHDVIIKGNTKTKDFLIEAEMEPFKSSSTLQELLDAARVVNLKLQDLEAFDSVSITLDAGPPELPGTANVIVDVVETASPLSGQLGAYTKAEARSSTFEASLKYKNFFGYGDMWDGSFAYGCDHSAEISAGVYLPKFKRLVTPVTARAFLLSQDWEKFSSYKERSLGISLGLLSTKYHDLSYSLAWRTLTDPSQMASRPIRRQLGHGLLSSLKYTFKFDRRNSSLRPTKGYAFASSTQIGGLAPDSNCLRFVRQEIDLRYVLPLGFCRAALNFGISGGVMFPWGSGYLNKPSPLTERFFLGGNVSPICTLGGPTALWGFKTRGLGPAEPRRNINDVNADPSGIDFLGGDLAATAYVDLSFDFPVKFLRERGIHGHVFACAGNIAKLTENEYRNFSSRKFLESCRTSVGVGVVLPTSLFRMELNYCKILNKVEHDRGKSGVWFTFSAPS